MSQRIRIYCADCRGKFELERSDVIEDEIIECDLCGAEMVVLQEEPIKIKLYNDEDFY